MLDTLNGNEITLKTIDDITLSEDVVSSAQLTLITDNGAVSTTDNFKVDHGTSVINIDSATSAKFRELGTGDVNDIQDNMNIVNLDDPNAEYVEPEVDEAGIKNIVDPIYTEASNVTKQITSPNTFEYINHNIEQQINNQPSTPSISNIKNNESSTAPAVNNVQPEIKAPEQPKPKKIHQ